MRSTSPARALGTALVFCLALAAGALLRPARAEAACNALALCSCTASATGVAFGPYNTLLATPNDSAGSVTVSCTLVVALSGSYTVSLSSGNAASFGPRTMTNGGSQLGYNLYLDTSRTEIWGDGTGGTLQVIGSFTALLTNTQTFAIFGRIPAGQNVAAGVYMDTIIVTVTY